MRQKQKHKIGVIIHAMSNWKKRHTQKASLRWTFKSKWNLISGALHTDVASCK